MEFYCDACVKRGWHTHPPLFEDEKPNQSHPKAVNQPIQGTTVKFEELNPIRETSSSAGSEKTNDESDGSKHSPPAAEPSNFFSSGHGDVMRSLQNLRERVTILEKENEALQLSSRSKNPKKREFSDD